MITLKVDNRSFSVGTDWGEVNSLSEKPPAIWMIDGIQVSKDEFEKIWNKQRDINPVPDRIEYIYPFEIFVED